MANLFTIFVHYFEILLNTKQNPKQRKWFCNVLAKKNTF